MKKRLNLELKKWIMKILSVSIFDGMEDEEEIGSSLASQVCFLFFHQLVFFGFLIKTIYLLNANDKQLCG